MTAVAAVAVAVDQLAAAQDVEILAILASLRKKPQRLEGPGLVLKASLIAVLLQASQRQQVFRKLVTSSCRVLTLLLEARESHLLGLFLRALTPSLMSM